MIRSFQIDGYFPDGSETNCYNNEDGFPCHDSQFVIRLPEKVDWNGKLVVTGAPGVRKQYALRPILPCYWAAFGELEEWGREQGRGSAAAWQQDGATSHTLRAPSRMPTAVR